MIPLLNHTEDTIIVSIALIIAATVIGKQLKNVISAIENRNRDEIVNELITAEHKCSSCGEEE